jgi:ketosteroid isomerase-like protein
MRFHGYLEAATRYDDAPRDAANADAAQRFVVAHAHGQWEVVEALLATDAVWHVAELDPRHGVQQILADAQREAALVDPGSVALTMRSVSAEGPAVALETHLVGRTSRGKDFALDSVHVLVFNVGKVRIWRQYLDRTPLAAAVSD